MNENTIFMQIDEVEAKLLLRILREGDVILHGTVPTGDEIDTLLVIEERLAEALVVLERERENVEAHKP